MRLRWFLFFFLRSVGQRKGRIAIASLSVLLAVGIITAMIGLTAGIREKLGAELKAYGANVIISPEKGDALPADAVGRVSGIGGVEEATGQVFDRVRIGGREVEVIGLEIGRLKERSWRLSGAWPERKGEVLIGVNLREAGSLDMGRTVRLEREGRWMECRIAGIFEKGGTEDSAVIMSISDVWTLSGTEKRLDAILVRGKAGSLDRIVGEIRAAVPGAAVKTLRQVALAEESLLFKMQLLMALVTLVVVFATAISVTSTMGANVLERREEIGLMKAIGATHWGISSFYSAEALLIGMLGGVTGFAAGLGAAEAVSRWAFRSFIPMPWYLPVLSFVAGLLISMVAGYFPVRDAMRCDPAVVLRGE